MAADNDSLRSKIAETIRREGPIPFSRYMAMCLYEPEIGYYTRPREQFGKAGDFYTSSDVHAVYGRLMCRQFEQMWRVLGSPPRVDILELGPGRGFFAADVLDWAQKKFPGFATSLRYRLVETSEYLRKRQKERLASQVERKIVGVFATIEEAAKKLGDNVIVFGNEFFDALPVEVVTSEGQIYIDVNQRGQFVETTRPVANHLLEFIDRYSVQPEDGARVEAAPGVVEWMKRISGVLAQRRGFSVFVDYGYTREEQVAGRHLDTIMTYRQHTASPNVFAAPGEQDITAHVNFTALRAVARNSGLEELGLLTQSSFLIGVGEANEFADAFEDARLPQERAKVALQLKHLVTPDGIGETFQVLVLGKGVGRNEAKKLSGLKFAH
ncbi:MAG TPA: SAM-dependent methyltransferase [Clostridia bacterium]|nr:SAM-dependent methyltransferase [Clostridia bacterium]